MVGNGSSAVALVVAVTAALPTVDEAQSGVPALPLAPWPELRESGTASFASFTIPAGVTVVVLIGST